jgi:ribosomal protein L11 methyltransferase
MSWLQISINTTKDTAESAEDALFSAGAQTVTLTDAADQPILEPGVNEVPIWNAVIITGLFDFDASDGSAEQRLLEIIDQSLPGIKHTCSTEILEDQNWTRAWMDHYHAMQFGKRLWVCPLHIDPPEPDAINLRLDPGLAFGTGTHPTTSLCLRWLDRNISTQKTLLDYGCGSGILAIAACMLGIEHADGVDIDPQALIASRDNAETNQVTDNIKTWLPEDFQKMISTKDTSYGIVVANILSGPLAELAPMLASHTKPGGDIVLSGILKEQAESVLETYSEFFEMDEPQFEEDWVLLHGVKSLNA